jgi:hypothetical protein
MHVTDSIQIDAPIEKVFEVVNDHHIEVWAKTDYDLYYPMERDLDNPVGTTIVQGVRGVKGFAWFYTITAYDKPNHLGLHIDSSTFSANATYSFVTVEDATRLDYSIELSFVSVLARIFSWILMPLMAKGFRQEVTEGLAKFKALAET